MGRVFSVRTTLPVLVASEDSLIRSDIRLLNSARRLLRLLCTFLMFSSMAQSVLLMVEPTQLTNIVPTARKCIHFLLGCQRLVFCRSCPYQHLLINVINLVSGVPVYHERVALLPNGVDWPPAWVRGSVSAPCKNVYSTSYPPQPSSDIANHGSHFLPDPN